MNEGYILQAQYIFHVQYVSFTWQNVFLLVTDCVQNLYEIN